MPTTPSTDIEVAQKAMVLIGLEPLTSFTDATDEALVANTIYEDVVADCLGQHNWNFATGQKTLSRLTDVPVDDGMQPMLCRQIQTVISHYNNNRRCSPAI